MAVYTALNNFPVKSRELTVFQALRQVLPATPGIDLFVLDGKAIGGMNSADLMKRGTRSFSVLRCDHKKLQVETGTCLS